MAQATRPATPRPTGCCVSHVLPRHQHKTRGRKDAVVRAQYRRAQPAGMFGAMPFSMADRILDASLAGGMTVHWDGLTLQEAAVAPSAGTD